MERRAARKPIAPKRAALAVIVLVALVGVGSAVVLGGYEERRDEAAVGTPAVPDDAKSPTPTPSATPTPTPESPPPADVDSPGSIDVVVNKQRPLPADFAPPELTATTRMPNPSGEVIRPEAAKALDDLYEGARSQGVELVLVSGYRSFAEQEIIYENKRAESGGEADRVSARPGHSEHQTGLAADVGRPDGQCTLQPCFGETAEGKWLAENAWRYGFLLRYPQDLTPVIGYAYEPWHFRFVGVETATRMHHEGVRTLEEYRGLPAAPDYP